MQAYYSARWTIDRSYVILCMWIDPCVVYFLFSLRSDGVVDLYLALPSLWKILFCFSSWNELVPRLGDGIYNVTFITIEQ